MKLNALGILDGTEAKPNPKADAKIVASYAERRSKMAGAIFETLDESQANVLLDNISSIDVAIVYKKLLNTYEPKTSGTRIAIQIGRAHV